MPSADSHSAQPATAAKPHSAAFVAASPPSELGATHTASAQSQQRKQQHSNRTLSSHSPKMSSANRSPTGGSSNGDGPGYGGFKNGGLPGAVGAVHGLGMHGYGDVYSAAGINPFPTGAPPAVNGQPNPGSPFLGVQGSPNPATGLGFSAATTQGLNGLPAAQAPNSAGVGGSFSGSAYSPSLGGGAYDGSGMAGSPNPYSPNPYAPSFVSSAGPGPDFGLGATGLGFGANTLMGGMLGSPNLMLGSPGLGSPSMSHFGSPYQGFGMGSPNLSAPGVQSGRTVYVGNLPSDASVDELLSQVRFGPIDSVKILPEKSCAFISFLDPTTAAAFHSDAMMRKISLHEQDLKIGWGKPSVVPNAVLMAVQQQGATRNVYLGNLDESVTEQSLRDDLARFGPIDQVKIVRDKNIGFVHFLSIATAMKVVQQLSQEPEWAGKRINFGKDRCAYVPKNQHQQQQHNMAAAAMGSMAANYGGFGGYGTDLAGSMSPMALAAASGDPNAQPGNRTVYLGNIHPDTTIDEICNAIRGGILQHIRFIPDKHICFVTFVDPACALAFFQTATYHGIALHNRRLKVGWGKHSGPTSPGIAMVVQAGGSRNVYVGNIDDFEAYSEERLREDFSEYGEIELVNSLREKNCAFINFTSIANAIKAIEAVKSDPEYSRFKIAYGKDRCGGAPRSFRAFEHHLNNNHSSPSIVRSPFLDASFTSPLPVDTETAAQIAQEKQSQEEEGPGGLVFSQEAADAAAH